MAPKGKSRSEDEAQVIYRPWITLKNGKRLYASQFGLRAFRLVIKPKA